MSWWTKYDSKKLLAIVLIVSGYLVWPKDSERPPSPVKESE